MKTLSSLIVVSVLAATSAPLFADSILYVDDSNGLLAQVDADTGAVTDIGTTTYDHSAIVLTDIAMNSSGALYGISFTNLYSVNTSNADLTRIGSFASTDSAMNGLVFNSTGTLYAASGDTNKIFTLNTSTGAATTLTGTTGAGVDASGDLAFNPDIGGNLYESDTSGDLVKITLPPPQVSGAVVGSFDLSPSSLNEDMYGMATGTDGVLYGTDKTSIYTINTSTGKATYLSTFSDPTHNFCKNEAYAFGATAPFPSNPVPEPTTLGLMAIGGMMLLAKRRKKA